MIRNLFEIIKNIVLFCRKDTRKIEKSIDEIRKYISYEKRSYKPFSDKVYFELKRNNIQQFIDD